MSYYDPLVLVDYVAVNNQEKTLAATPASISSIEVLRLPYVKGVETTPENLNFSRGRLGGK